MLEMVKVLRWSGCYSIRLCTLVGRFRVCLLRWSDDGICCENKAVVGILEY
jgi:hypothetical protein